MQRESTRKTRRKVLGSRLASIVALSDDKGDQQSTISIDHNQVWISHGIPVLGAGRLLWVQREIIIACRTLKHDFAFSAFYYCLACVRPDQLIGTVDRSNDSG